MGRLFLTLFGLFFILQYSFGQGESCRKSTEGSDFWFGFMESRNYQKDHFTQITVTSPSDASCSIYIGRTTTVYTTLSITANVPSKLTIDWNLVEAIGSEKTEDKGIHLVSTQPVNVYALNWCPNSSDVALIFPTASLGKEYYAMCYTPHINGNGIDGGNGRNSEFLIVASEDSTIVTITPTKVTHNSQPANIPFTVFLWAGQVYQVQSENLPGSAANGQGDLTGSYITSDKPIAFYSGSLSTTVPGDDGVSAWDHLYEQIPPVQTWGRKFVAVPLMSREKDTYRILASEDNTSVKIGSNPIVTLNKGKYYEFMLLYNQPTLIESDKPVLLAQYSNSQSVDKTYTGGDGDPFMVIVSPVTQTRDNVTFVAYDSDNITDKYFINVVVKDDAVGNIVLDNTTTIPFTSLSGSGYSYAQVQITKGNHLIKATDSTKGFIAYVYGFGGVESYGYGVGYNLDIVLDLGSDILGNGEKKLVRCDGAGSLTLNAGNGFDSYLWYTGSDVDHMSSIADATEASIQVSDEGFYKVIAKTGECELSDVIEIVISRPKIDLEIDQTVCNPDTMFLDAGTIDDFKTFLWTTPQGEYTTQQVSATQTGPYSVIGTNIYGCVAKDTIALTFVDRPKIDLSNLQTLICGAYQTELEVSADKLVHWSLSGNALLTIDGLKVSVDPSNSGSYPVALTATDESTCASTENFDLEFYNTPTADFSIDSTKCHNYNLEVNYTGDADLPSSYFTWVFDGDTIHQGPGESFYTVPLGINRATRDLTMTLVDKNGCSNSKTISDIKVIPNLKMWAEDSVGCESFTVNFSSDNTETVDYLWNFGDSSPNSTVAAPEHTYSSTGYYNVSLKVTTVDKGCSNEVTIDSMIYVAPIPTVGFTPMEPECLDTGFHAISYLGSGNLLDTYHWDLTAFDPEEIIHHPDTTQGPFEFDLINKPLASIGLSVKSSYGCLSDTAIVEVKRIPKFSITSDPIKGCTPLTAFISAQTADPVDQVNYNWDFGDGESFVGSEVTHDYGDPDHQYTIELTATSSTTGCKEILLKRDWVWTYPKPQAAFEVDHKIVYSDLPDVKFTDLSLGAPVAWLWNFGDGVTSALQNPNYHFVKMGHQLVTFKVSNAFGCTDETSDTVLVAFDRLFPPNGFSPKAPMAIDREFKLFAEGVSSQEYHLTVFSRWNDLVFEARDAILGWDGRMKNGNFAPAGVYLWVLEYFDFLGRPHRQSGNVTLVY